MLSSLSSLQLSGMLESASDYCTRSEQILPAILEDPTCHLEKAKALREEPQRPTYLSAKVFHGQDQTIVCHC